MKFKRLFWVFAVSLLIIGFFSFSSLIFSGVKAEADASTGLVAQVGFEPIDPYLLVLGDGTRVWITTFGNYTMSKDYANRMSFAYRDGTQLITESLFWVNATYGGKPLALSKLFKADITVSVANDTMFRFKHPLISDKADIAGYLTVTYNFSKDARPKISIVFENVLLTEWQITWCLLPSKTYLKTDETHAVAFSATETVSFGAKTFVELGDDANPQSWRMWSLTTWEDYGAAIVYGGLEKVLGGKGLTVVFPVNETVIDPSQVAYVYYSNSMSYSRRNFWANGYFRQFYLDIYNYDFDYKGSIDGVTWNNLTTIAGAVSDEFVTDICTWLENDTFVHLVFIDMNDSAPAGQKFTVSYQTATLGVGSISLGTRQTICTLVDDRRQPTVTVDSNGYPWVAYLDIGLGTCVVQKATAKDGSSWGSETSLFTYAYTSYYKAVGVIVPLDSGKMYLVFEDSHPWEPAQGRLYNGTGWESAKQIRPAYSDDGSVKTTDRLSVVVKSNFDIVYYHDQLSTLTANGTHVYTYSHASDSWSYTKWVSTQGMVGCVTINKTTDDMWFFYAHNPTNCYPYYPPVYLVGDGIYYRKYTNSTNTWGNEVTVDATITSLCDLHGFYEQSSGHLGIAYVTDNWLYFIVVTPPVYSQAMSVFVTVAASSSKGLSKILIESQFFTLTSALFKVFSRNVFESQLFRFTDSVSSRFQPFKILSLGVSIGQKQLQWLTSGGGGNTYPYQLLQAMKIMGNVFRTTPHITYYLGTSTVFTTVVSRVRTVIRNVLDGLSINVIISRVQYLFGKVLLDDIRGFLGLSSVTYPFVMPPLSPVGSGGSPVVVTPAEEAAAAQAITAAAVYGMSTEVLQRVSIGIAGAMALIFIWGVTGESKKNGKKKKRSWSID